MTRSNDQLTDYSKSHQKVVHDQPNIQRRRILQGAILSTTAIAMAGPGLANALCSSNAHATANTKTNASVAPIANNEDIAIELLETENTVQNGALAWVTISNNSQRSIKLSHVSPGAISTQKGVYQLNAMLSNNPLSLRSGGVYQFWLTPDNGSQASLSSKPKVVAGNVHTPTTVKVSVTTKLATGTKTGSQRVQALIS